MAFDLPEPQRFRQAFRFHLTHSHTDSSSNHRFDDAATVTLSAGPSHKKFYPHKSILCARSSFFRAALSSTFKESAESSISLPEDDAQIMEDYLTYVYAEQVEHPTISDLDDKKTAAATYSRAIELYGFAEKISKARLKKAIIDQIFDAIAAGGRRYGPPKQLVPRVYELTPPKSAMRRLVVAHWVWNGRMGTIASDAVVKKIARVPEFAADLAGAFAGMLAERDRVNPFLLADAACFYEGEMRMFYARQKKTRAGRSARTKGGRVQGVGAGFKTWLRSMLGPKLGNVQPTAASRTQW